MCAAGKREGGVGMSLVACMRSLVSILLVASVGLRIAPTANADEGPHCGIYAVYGAVSAVGVRGSFESLLDRRFVSGLSGSTVSDLVNAAKHLGVDAAPLTGLGAASLFESRDPLILHVASFGQLEVYNHWLLFLGIESGKARTVDSTGSMHLMNVSELLARWDGVGIAVFTGAEPRTRFGSIELVAIGWWALLVVMAVGVAVFLVRRVSTAGVRESVTGSLVLATTTVLLIAVREVYSASSLSRNPDCVRFISAAEGLRNLPELSLEEVIEFTKRPDAAVIFDVRYAGDMNYGHIPGATGLPVNSTQEEVAAAVETIPRDKTIILYCQSSGCRFSDRMAVVLTSFGFTDIRIYRDGWVGWEEGFAQSTNPQVSGISQ